MGGVVSAVSLMDGECQTVVDAIVIVGSSSLPITVTVTETVLPATQLVNIVVDRFNLDGSGVVTTVLTGTNTVTRDVKDDWGYVVTFTNRHTGGEGCTPGFWKTRPHQDDWPPTGFSQNNLYDAVFGVNNLIDPSLTLLEGVRKNGNSYNSLVRHSVAALLNASHPDVAYGLSPAEVIAIVQAAHASGDFDTAKNQLEGLNQRFCPIG